MKRIIIVLAILFLAVTSAFTSEYFMQVIDALNKKDMAEAELLLTDWESKEPDNPKLCIGFFNYYFMQACSNPVTVSFAVVTLNNGEQKVVEQKIADPDLMHKAIDYMDRGIVNYPDRLDFYSTRHQALFLIREFDELCKSAESMLKRSVENKNNWISERDWNGEGKRFMFEELNRVYYALSQFFSETEISYGNLLALEEKLYPDDELMKIHKKVFIGQKKQFSAGK